MLLEASAGTGKTYALERMVARLVARNENPLKIDEILVVTFTNRAAREMKERIRSLLSLRAREADRDPMERERCREAVSGFDRAAIYTIHGFCQMVLSSWPFESSSPFRQELVPGGVMESAELRSWIAGLKKEALDRDLFRIAYREAGSLESLIAGISKSMADDNIPPGAVVLPTLEESAAFDAFVETSALPGSPLALAAEALFSRSWSDETVKELIKTATGSKRGKTAGSLEKIRLHMAACGNLCDRGEAGIIPLSRAVFGDPAGLKVGGHFLELLRAGIILAGNGESGETASLISALSTLIHEMEPYVEDSSGKLISLVEPYMQCAFQDKAEKAVKDRLENLKNQSGRWGYADLIRRVADKVADGDSPLLKVLRRRFKAGLIDEFQDTDPRQWNLFQTIFGHSGTGHVLALIGDPKQSIYGFRGTGLQAYNSARSAVDEDRVFRLDTNYRSTPRLVDAANRFFSPLFTPDFEAVHSGKTDSPKLIWPDGETAVTLYGTEHKEDAAAAIAGEIRLMLDPMNGAKWQQPDGPERAVSASDIAVLVRSTAEGDLVLESLAQRGIPGVNIRNRSIFTQSPAGVLRGLLDAFENPRKVGQWKSVLLGSFFELPADLLMRFQEEGRLDVFVEKGGEWRKLFLQGRSTEAFDDFFMFSTRVGEWAAEAGSTALGEYLKMPWTQRVLKENGGMRTWQNWRQLSELIQNRQAEGVTDISRIKSWMREQAEIPESEGSSEVQRLESEDPAVKVLTMHSAKGLEFPLVFILGGFRSGSRKGGSGDYRFDREGKLVVDRVCRESNREAHLAYSWEEDKRLWYVAFTRAGVKLWIPLPRGETLTEADSLLDEAFRNENGASTEVSRIPPHELLGKKDTPVFRENLDESIRKLADEMPGLFSTTVFSSVNLPPLEPEPREKPLAAELPSEPPSRRDPATGSYTSLVKSAFGQDSDEDEDRDVDFDSISPSIPADSPETEPLPMAADRGALFGTLVHALLEECDFQKVRDNDEAGWQADSETDELFADLSRRFYPRRWYGSRKEDLKRLVWNTLRSPVPGLGRLCDVEKSQRREELEFLMVIPRGGELSSGDLQTMISRGFLKGFIDLCLNTGGRWWVVDWKSNVPPGRESAGSYDDETLKKMMDHSHYHLQYELYLLSLCRTLSGSRGTPVNWEEEIGGAVYLFVRGTRESDSRGVFTSKPSLERMLTLASVMGLEGVVK